MTRAIVLLAAGVSNRFGIENKLVETFDGQPLVAHAERAAMASPFDLRIAVVSQNEVAKFLPEFDIVITETPENGQSASLRIGIARAAKLGADCATVVLGDMPRVSAGSIHAVTKLALKCGAAACWDGKRRAPPAAFSHLHFESLMKIDGDKGARSLLGLMSVSQLVRVSEFELFDVDTKSDIATN